MTTVKHTGTGNNIYVATVLMCFIVGFIGQSLVLESQMLQVNAITYNGTNLSTAFQQVYEIPKKVQITYLPVIPGNIVMDVFSTLPLLTICGDIEINPGPVKNKYAINKSSHQTCGTSQVHINNTSSSKNNRFKTNLVVGGESANKNNHDINLVVGKESANENNHNINLVVGGEKSSFNNKYNINLVVGDESSKNN